MTLRGAKTAFLDIQYATIETALTMVCILLQETVSTLTCIFEQNTVSMSLHVYLRMYLILQTINYRGNKKFVLVLVQCHDGIIMNSLNLFSHLTLIFDSYKTNLYRLSILHKDNGLEPEPNFKINCPSMNLYTYHLYPDMSIGQQPLVWPP